MHRKLHFIITIIALFGCSVFAQAQTATTYVSAKTGVDAGTCTLAAPCRNLTFALTQTQAGGVITLIDSGDYANANITKAITIQAAPGVAALIASGTTATGLSIAPGTTNFVILRGLMFDGQGTANFGVQSTNTGGVTIENCHFKNFAGAAIQLTGNAGKHSVSNTVVQQSANGIVVAITTGTNTTATALIENCRVEKSATTAFSMTANGTGNKIRAMIFNSSAINNGGNGFSASGNTGGASEVTLENCVAVQNATGLIANAPSTMRVSNTLILGCTAGIAGTSILSRSNNTSKAHNVFGNFSGTFTAK